MIIVKFGGGSGSIKVIAQAIGEPATNKDKKERLAEIIDNVQSDIASLCNERGCNIPSDPSFPQIINGISAITHFTKPAQITGLRAVGAHDTANIIDLSWSNPSDDKNFSGVKILYKTGGYPSSPTDGTVAYDGAGTSVSLGNMTNGTTYYFRAFAYGSVDSGVVYNDLTTGAQCTGVSTLNPPSQITGLVATVGSTTSGYVRLAWTNPSDSKFKGVRILYKTGGYPTTVNDGTVLYTGTSNSVEKSGLANGTTYYFRAFAYNLSNNVYAYNTGTSGAQCTGMPFISRGQQIFTSSSTFTVPAGINKIDIFLIGGGGGGAYEWYNGGGGGGYTKTVKNIAVTSGQSLSLVIGAGGSGCYFNDWGGNGGSSTASINGVSYIAQGGERGFDPRDDTSGRKYGKGGNGGSGGGVGFDSSTIGGSDGSNGGASNYSKYTGIGQGTTTRAFGESNNTLYAGGGGGATSGSRGAGGEGGGGAGASSYSNGMSGTPNTGGGGGGGCGIAGGSYVSGAGGSGIAIVRWGY